MLKNNNKTDTRINLNKINENFNNIRLKSNSENENSQQSNIFAKFAYKIQNFVGINTSSNKNSNYNLRLKTSEESDDSGTKSDVPQLTKEDSDKQIEEMKEKFKPVTSWNSAALETYQSQLIEAYEQLQKQKELEGGTEPHEGDINKMLKPQTAQINIALAAVILVGKKAPKPNKPPQTNTNNENNAQGQNGNVAPAQNENGAQVQNQNGAAGQNNNGTGRFKNKIEKLNNKESIKKIKLIINSKDKKIKIKNIDKFKKLKLEDLKFKNELKEAKEIIKLLEEYKKTY